MLKIRRRLAFSMLGGLLLGACGGNGGGPVVEPLPDEFKRTPLEKLALQPFDADCVDYLDYTADALTDQYLTPTYCAFDGPCPVFAAEGSPPTPPPMATPAPGASAGDGESAGPDRVSGTNTQEAGVDEPDIVKADAAGRLYVLTGQRLRIFDGYPPAGIGERAITSFDLAADDSGFYPGDLLLDDASDRVVVLGASYAGNVGRAVAKIIDVSTPTAPRLLRSVSVDGSPLAVRSVEGRIHRVSRYDAPVPAWFYDSGDPLVGQRTRYEQAQAEGDETEAAAIRESIRAEVGRRVRAAGADGFLPHRRVTEAGGSVVDTPLACDAISHPDVTTALGIALVDSFDNDGSNGAFSGIVNNSYLVYGSTNNLYLLQSSLGWFFAPQQVEESVIYRLALSADGAATSRAIGKIDGSVTGSYQLSEYEGALRVSSTERRNTPETSTTYNHVTVLDATSNGTMTQLGAVDENDLAPGETIQGTRFIGPRGYVVTFRQVDPLFAIDLSDPTAPVVTDELKIPGFSSYLMPLGDDKLLTIGRAGTDEGLSGGVAVQLFDVGDMRNIRQLAVSAPAVGDGGYSYSAAEYDPHAFSYFSDSEEAALPGTLSIPLYSSGGDFAGGDTSFSGFLVLRVDAAAAEPLRELGRIDHGPLVDQSGGCQTPPPGSAGGAAPDCYFYRYTADPLRSVFLQDDAGRYLLTISSAGVVASDAAQPATSFGSQAWSDELP
ncbi:MAG TPA: beta-propeller domain-containing protein [Fontimonas sp.]